MGGAVETLHTKSTADSSRQCLASIDHLLLNNVVLSEHGRADSVVKDGISDKWLICGTEFDKSL